MPLRMCATPSFTNWAAAWYHRGSRRTSPGSPTYWYARSVPFGAMNRRTVVVLTPSRARHIQISQAARRPLDVTHGLERRPQHDTEAAALDLDERENCDATRDLVRPRGTRQQRPDDHRQPRG